MTSALNAFDITPLETVVRRHAVEVKMLVPFIEHVPSGTAIKTVIVKASANLYGYSDHDIQVARQTAITQAHALGRLIQAANPDYRTPKRY